eukprot:9018797-Alexandrium_andersonii.AAC.1
MSAAAIAARAGRVSAHGMGGPQRPSLNRRPAPAERLGWPAVAGDVLTGTLGASRRSAEMWASLDPTPSTAGIRGLEESGPALTAPAAGIRGPGGEGLPLRPTGIR